jgi:YggT family protein
VTLESVPTAVLFSTVALGSVLGYLVEAYVFILIARALVSWFPVRPGTPFYGVVRILDALTEPVLRPIRRILPPVRAGGMAIDLSIIVAVIGLEVIASVILSRV